MFFFVFCVLLSESSVCPNISLYEAFDRLVGRVSHQALLCSLLSNICLAPSFQGDFIQDSNYSTHPKSHVVLQLLTFGTDCMIILVVSLEIQHKLDEGVKSIEMNL